MNWIKPANHSKSGSGRIIILLKIAPDLKITRRSSSIGNLKIQAYSNAGALRIDVVNVGRVAKRGVIPPSPHPEANNPQRPTPALSTAHGHETNAKTERLNCRSARF
ncbi:hypothetical protein VXE32_006346 [Burkholderia cepacia]|nr:hypothetical protein [Burkholderia cepacia]